MTDFSLAPLSLTEQYILEDMLRDEKYSSIGNFFYMLILSFLMPFFPARRKSLKDYPASREEYFQQVIFYAVIFILGFFAYYILKTRQLRSDLAAGTKIVAYIPVLKKERSHTAGTFTIWLETEEQDFKSFNINEAEYNGVVVGQRVRLEYAENSKFLFKTNWQALQE